MSLENIGLILIIMYLGWRLFNVLNTEKNKTNISKPQILVRAEPVSLENFRDEEFLSGAKLAFHMIVSAFAKGKKKELKMMLSPKVYQTFVDAIDTREKNKQILDFSLICINSAKVLQKVEKAKEVTVQFISEQINILKDENGLALEGDPMNVSVMCDTWTFRQQKNNTWIVCATKSEMANV